MKGLHLNRIILVSLASLTAHCSSHSLQVDYPVYREPADGFTQLDYLGVTRTKGLDKKTTDLLVKKLTECGQYSKVNRLDTIFNIKKGDIQDVTREMKNASNKFQDARYVHGILVVQLLHNNSRSSQSQVIRVKVEPQQDFSWYDSYGNGSFPWHPLFGAEAVAPKQRFVFNRQLMRTQRHEIELRYILYNKRQGRVILDRETSAIGSFSVYSKDGENQFAKTHSHIIEQLFDRLTRAICPQIASATRQLMIPNGESKPDILVQKGVDLADEGMWERAADQWRQAILIEKNHPQALHNLGVFYERSGRIPNAMEEFYKSKVASRGKYLQFDDSLRIFRPTLQPQYVEPRIITLSGANWLNVYDHGRLKVGQEYPVFRTRRVMTKPSYLVRGMEALEVGRIEIVYRDGEFAVARVKEFIEPLRVEVGDLVPLN